MTIPNGSQIFTPATGELNREYSVYWNDGKILNYIGSTPAESAQKALKIVLALKFKIELGINQTDFNEADHGVWQLWIENVEYVVKRK